MKRCPECRRDYYDDTLLYCLDDGNALLEGPASESGVGDEPATAILHTTDAVGDAPTRAQIHMTGQTAVLPIGTGDIAPKPRGFDKRLIAAPLLAVLIAVAGFVGYRYLSPFGSKQIESIAVMPFVNESGNADSEYLSDGMTETLIVSLTQVSNLNVKARSTVFRYKGKETDIKTLGKELNVQAILYGRVAQRGDQVTLGLELVDVQTENAIWSQQYTRKQTDLVSLQSEIARDVSSKLKSRLSSTDEAKVTNVYTTNSEAYQLYLKGNYFTSKLTNEGFRTGNEFFEQAIRLDPNYALAYNGIAFNQLAAMDWFIEPKVAGPKASEAVKKAAAINNELAETQLLRGLVAHWVEWDWITAESAYKKAIELNSSGFRPNGYYAWFLTNMGRNEEAVASARRSQQLDPISAEANWYLGMALLAAGRTEEAIATLQTAIDIDPTYFYAYSFLGRAYLQADKKQEALAAFKKAHELESENSENWANLAYGHGVSGNKAEAEKIIEYLIEKSKKTYVAPYYLAIAYAGLDDNEQTFKWLERAYADKSDSLVLYLTADPQMKSIRIDPRYKDLLKRMNLPE